MNPFGSKGRAPEGQVIEGGQAAGAAPAAAPSKGRAPKKKGPVDRRRRLSILCGALVAVSVASVGVGAAAYGTASALNQKLTADMVKVITVKDEVKTGTQISADNLVEASVPRSYVPTDAATKPDQLAGKTALADLTAGVPVSLGTIEASDAPASITAAVTAGHLAKMYAFDAAPGMSPLLAPGDYVTISGISTSRTGVSAVTKFQGVRILAVNGNMSGRATDAYATLTFELTADQVDALSGLTLSVAAEPASEHGGLDTSRDASNDGKTATAPAEGQTTAQPAGTGQDQAAAGAAGGANA